MRNMGGYETGDPRAIPKASGSTTSAFVQDRPVLNTTSAL
jgi:hypothetical protein